MVLHLGAAAVGNQGKDKLRFGVPVEVADRAAVGQALMAVEHPAFQEVVHPVHRQAVGGVAGDIALAVLVAEHGCHRFRLEDDRAVKGAAIGHHHADAAQVAPVNPHRAHGEAVVLVRIDRGIPHIAQQHAAGAGRAAGGIQAGDLFRFVQKRGMIGRVDMQRRKKALRHRIIEVFACHSLNQRPHDARAKVGIPVCRAGLFPVPVAALLVPCVDQVGQGIALPGVSAFGTQRGGVRHQVAQCDWHLGIVQVVHRVAQVIADAVVQGQQALLHQLHHMDAGDQLCHRGNAEIGFLRYRLLGLLVRIAVIVFVDDFSVLGHTQGSAGRFVGLEDPGQLVLQLRLLRQGAGSKQHKNHHAGKHTLHPVIPLPKDMGQPRSGALP